uniref:Uncharacterized protein n=1 Tax=Ditylum brightwellii TaxID=49249 RepID=A0A7S4S249_9STRA
MENLINLALISLLFIPTIATAAASTSTLDATLLRSLGVSDSDLNSILSEEDENFDIPFETSTFVDGMDDNNEEEDSYKASGDWWMDPLAQFDEDDNQYEMDDTLKMNNNAAAAEERRTKKTSQKKKKKLEIPKFHFGVLHQKQRTATTAFSSTRGVTTTGGAINNSNSIQAFILQTILKTFNSSPLPVRCIASILLAKYATSHIVRILSCSTSQSNGKEIEEEDEEDLKEVLRGLNGIEDETMMSRRPCISGGGRAVMEEEQPQEREGEVGQEEDINELRGLGFEGRGLPYERSIPRTVAAHQDEDLSYCEEEIDEDGTIDLQDNKTNPCVGGDATEEGDSYCEEEIDEDGTIDLQDNKTNPCVGGDATEEGDEEEMTMYESSPSSAINTPSNEISHKQVFSKPQSSNIATPSFQDLHDKISSLQERLQAVENERDLIKNEHETAIRHMKQMSSQFQQLKTNYGVLKQQSREKDIKLTYIVQKERMRAKEELQRLKEGMIGILEKERKLMRMQLAKQGAPPAFKQGPPVYSKNAPVYRKDTPVRAVTVEQDAEEEEVIWI